MSAADLTREDLSERRDRERTVTVRDALGVRRRQLVASLLVHGAALENALFPAASHAATVLVPVHAAAVLLAVRPVANVAALVRVLVRARAVEAVFFKGADIAAAVWQHHDAVPVPQAALVSTCKVGALGLKAMLL